MKIGISSLDIGSRSKKRQTTLSLTRALKCSMMRIKHFFAHISGICKDCWDKIIKEGWKALGREKMKTNEEQVKEVKNALLP